MSRPQAADYPEYFKRYIDLVKEDDLLQALNMQLPVITERLTHISESDSAYSYAPGKWTIKELLQHIIDAERVFNYRALCIARKETASLPSFEEDDYAAASDANRRSWNSLVNEFINLRRSTTDLFESFTPDMLNRKGTASGKDISVLSLGYISVGHIYHHLTIIRERYSK
jgi:hypothetical protein